MSDFKACLQEKRNKRRWADCQLAGRAVRLRSVTAKEWGEVNALIARGEVAKGYATLVVKVVCDKDGNPELTPEDVAWLVELDSAEFKSLTEPCLDHCGFGDEPTVEDAAKN